MQPPQGNANVPMVILFIALSARVIAFRRSNKIPLGDAGNLALLSRIHAQCNCAEYMPLGLLLLLMAELSAPPGLGLHLAGICLVIGRIFRICQIAKHCVW